MAATEAGAKGLAFLRVVAGRQLEGAKALREGLDEAQAACLLDDCGAQEGDLLLLVAGKHTLVNKCAGPPIVHICAASCPMHAAGLMLCMQAASVRLQLATLQGNGCCATARRAQPR